MTVNALHILAPLVATGTHSKEVDSYENSCRIVAILPELFHITDLSRASVQSRAKPFLAPAQDLDLIFI
jgi:hypothetical protein